MNAEIGESNMEGAEEIVGGHGQYKRNKQGWELIALCREEELLDANSFTPQREKGNVVSSKIRNEAYHRPHLGVQGGLRKHREM